MSAATGMKFNHSEVRLSLAIWLKQSSPADNQRYAPLQSRPEMRYRSFVHFARYAHRLECDNFLANLDRTMPSNCDLIRDNLAGFDAMDYALVAGGYAEDATLHFMQNEPIQGRDNILDFFNRQFVPISNTRIEVRNIMEYQNLVMVERIDHYDYEGHPISCPVMCTVEMKDGKIVYWREYFDRQSAADQLPEENSE